MVSKEVAQATGTEVDYSLKKGLSDKYYKDLLMEAFKAHSILTRHQINQLLVAKLPDVMSNQQKLDKVGNILTYLRKKGCVFSDENRDWHYVKDLEK